MNVVTLSLIPHPGRPGMRVESGDAIRACGLPSAEGIELACESMEAVPIPGSQNPDDPDAPNYSYPAYSVTNAQCAFVDETASRATCTFDFAADNSPPRRTRAELIYRFRDLSNRIAHDYWATLWEVDASCLPDRR